MSLISPPPPASHTNPVRCQSGGDMAWSPDWSQVAFDVPLD